MRITVKDRLGTIAQDEALIHDVDDDGEVIAAAKRVCRAKSKTYPAGATIVVEKLVERDRWQQVRKLVG